MIIFDSPYLKIQLDENLNALTEEWKLDFTTSIQGEVFRKPLESLMATFKEKKISKWLCDNTEQKILPFAEQIWLETYFYPELVKNGLQTVALVNAKNILGTGYAKNRLQNLNESLKVEVFNKNKEAKAWLKSV